VPRNRPFPPIVLIGFSDDSMAGTIIHTVTRHHARLASSRSWQACSRWFVRPPHWPSPA